MPPVEAWRQVLVDGEAFLNDVHGSFSCTQCHGGVEASAVFDEAHTGLVTDPSGVENNACGVCHSAVAAHQEDSLHYSLGGYDTALYARSVPEKHAALEEMESYHCEGCHTTCGQCHVSQPTSVGGGLLEGHMVSATPPMGRTCTGCHGSRVNNEYTGRHEGYPADVHIRQERMACAECHTADQMHGVDVEAVHRYDGAQDPSCESCHAEQIGAGSGIPQHEAHSADLLSCQVCHSITYDNCWGCHVQQNEDGVAYYVVDDSQLTFMIGRNPTPSEARPYTYVPVRHVPVAPDSFDFYGEDLLPNFTDRPTWTYATPHNIQRITPQAEHCENCHDNPDIFLTAEKVIPDSVRDSLAYDDIDAYEALELEANRDVIVEGAPPLPPGYQPEPTAMPEEEEADDDVDSMFE